ncbi:MAG TPA: L-seryl-tRNA(Sec) selenium transferase [Longimicrobiales bacterium]
MTDPRRAIPSIDRLLASDAFAALLAGAPRTRVRDALQAVQHEVRRAAAGANAAPATDPAWYADRVRARLTAQARPSLRPVINATGVVLHTNLGRAPLARVAREAMERAAGGYSNLEYDLDAGARGSRYDHCTALLRELTGAEAALVVNNNAAALVLALNTLAEGRDAVVSRGELVEIGGSFRVPEIMAKSGARMREVGATNKTHLADYEAAVTTETGAILKVHRSNFRIVGFAAEVPLAELAGLGRARGVAVINDLGSGLLLDLRPLGLPYEPTAADALGAGADIVTMSGDKLLGGPQAGILLGRAEWIGRMRRNPLCRAFRVDKFTLAALEATLALYRDPDVAMREVPVLRMLSLGAAELERRAASWIERLGAAGVAADAVPGGSAVGGGAYPGVELPTTLVAVTAAARSATELEAALRSGEPAVVARIVDGRVVLDPRTVAEAEEDALLERVRDAVA